MKSKRATLTVMLLGSLALSANADECVRAGFVEALQGAAEVRHSESKAWQEVTVKDELCERDQLRTTEHSRASIRLINQTLVQLDANSTLTLTTVESDETPSVLDLLQGLIHTMSRVPRSLEIKTPFVNAAIEGTEFVVAANADSGKVAVLEGIVRVDNAEGVVRVHANEAASATENSAPQKQLRINPLDGVSWEETYLPLLTMDRGELTPATEKAWGEFQSSRPDLAIATLELNEAPSVSSKLLEAASLLSLGQTPAASAILESISPATPQSLSLQSSIAILKNEPDKAKTHIEKAWALDLESPEAWLAESYRLQSLKFLPQSLAAARQALEYAPDNALAAARVSELYLMTGQKEKALEMAQQAVDRAPKQDRAWTALGFAQLNTGQVGQAKKTFLQALELNSYNSQNHLGLGLSKIRLGDITEGREHLETAALLEPTNAVLRSYLGKAYFDENRTPLALDQYTLAEQYDPQDPTPLFYEALALSDQNRQVEALEKLQASIKRNDNRAIYRSNPLLDDDRSSRAAAEGSIYHALGFNQLALTPAANSLATAPTNASAHRLLADSYVGQHHRDLARINELHTARVLAPVSSAAIPGNLLRNHSTLLEHSGPLSGGYSEHNHLFSRSGAYGNAGFSIGSLNTYSSDLTAGLIDENVSLHASLHTLSTDGEYADSDYETTVGSIELKWDVSSKLHLTLLHDEDDTEKGMPSQQYFFSPDNSVQSRVNTESETDAISLHYQFSPATQLIGRISRSDSEALTDVGADNNVVVDYTAEKAEVQWAHDSKVGRWLAGAEKNDVDLTSTLSLTALPAPIANDLKQDEEILYAYYMSSSVNPALTTTLGLEHKKAYNPSAEKPEKRTLPKLGAVWSISDRWTVGLAYFETMVPTSSLTAHLSLQPTQIAGFNQVHRGSPTAHGKSTGMSLEWTPSARLSAGLRYLTRDNTNDEGFLTVENGTPVIQCETIENRVDNRNAWLYWSINDRLSLGLEHQYDFFSDNYESILGTTSDGFEKLKTRRNPLTLTYHPSDKLTVSWVNTYVHQKGIFWKNGATLIDRATVEHGDESFWLMDASLSYRLPKRRGQWTVGVKNLLAENYRYEDYNSYDPLLPMRTWVPSDYTKDRFWFTSLSLKF